MGQCPEGDMKSKEGFVLFFFFKTKGIPSSMLTIRKVQESRKETVQQKFSFRIRQPRTWSPYLSLELKHRWEAWNCPQLDEHQSRTWGLTFQHWEFPTRQPTCVTEIMGEVMERMPALCVDPTGLPMTVFTALSLRLEAWPLALTLEPRKLGLVLTADYLQVPAVQTGSCQYIHKEWTEREWRGKPFFSQIRFNYPSPKSLPSVVPAN